MPAKKRILVTGASGFIGAQVVDHLLQAGYAVKGTSRSSKADQLRKNCVNPDFEVITIDDLVTGDLTTALKGVDGVIHTASPLPLPGCGDDFYQITVEGTLNLLRHAYASKVYKVSIVGSIAATDTSPDQRDNAVRMVTSTDWKIVSKEEALSLDNPPSVRYRASKTLAEQAAWEFSDSHPEMELTTLLPPFVYGPLAVGQVVTSPTSTLSTNIWIYMLLAGNTAPYPRAVSPQCVDVRDVARAAVLSLNCSAVQLGERRRILLWGGSFTWGQAVKHIGTVKPELKSRLVDGGEPTNVEAAPAASLDTTQAHHLLGLNNFIRWETTVEDTVDSLLAKEMAWIH